MTPAPENRSSIRPVAIDRPCWKPSIGKPAPAFPTNAAAGWPAHERATRPPTSTLASTTRMPATIPPSPTALRSGPTSSAPPTCWNSTTPWMATSRRWLSTIPTPTARPTSPPPTARWPPAPGATAPAYPVQQLVVGIDHQKVVEAALFAWSDDENSFVRNPPLRGRRPVGPTRRSLEGGNLERSLTLRH